MDQNSISLSSFLKWLNPAAVLSAFTSNFGTTDVVGHLIQKEVSNFEAVGHDGIAKVVTISEASLTKWAQEVWADAGNSATDPGFEPFQANILAKMDSFAGSFADLVEAFIPQVVVDGVDITAPPALSPALSVVSSAPEAAAPVAEPTPVVTEPQPVDTAGVPIPVPDAVPSSVSAPVSATPPSII